MKIRNLSIILGYEFNNSILNCGEDGEQKRTADGKRDILSGNNIKARIARTIAQMLDGHRLSDGSLVKCTCGDARDENIRIDIGSDLFGCMITAENSNAIVRKSPSRFATSQSLNPVKRNNNLTTRQGVSNDSEKNTSENKGQMLVSKEYSEKSHFFESITLDCSIISQVELSTYKKGTTESKIRFKLNDEEEIKYRIKLFLDSLSNITEYANATSYAQSIRPVYVLVCFNDKPRIEPVEVNNIKTFARQRNQLIKNLTCFEGGIDLLSEYEEYQEFARKDIKLDEFDVFGEAYKFINDNEIYDESDGNVITYQEYKDKAASILLKEKTSKGKTKAKEKKVDESNVDESC